MDGRKEKKKNKSKKMDGRMMKERRWMESENRWCEWMESEG